MFNLMVPPKANSAVEQRSADSRGAGVDAVAEKVQPMDQATAKTKCVVAEYLRDLGLRDPDMVAQESQRIVEEAKVYLTPGDASDESVLRETAIRLTVKQLERWLEVLAVHGSPDQSQRLGSAIAVRLPGLLDRFPQPIHGDGPSSELVDSLHENLTPVVPPPRPHRMRRQVLPLIPSSFRRMGSKIHELVFGVASSLRD